MSQPMIAALFAALGVLLVISSVLVRSASKAKVARLHHFIGTMQGSSLAIADEMEPTGWQATFAKRLNRYFARRDYVQNTRIELVRAGLQLKPTQFFLVRMVLALGTALLGGAVLSSVGPIGRLVGIAAGLVIGYLLVRPFLGYRQRKRMDTFEKHFADGLDIMVGGLEAGSSLTAAVELVSREMPAPLSTEFARVLRDSSLGMSYEAAFNGMYERVPSDDVGMLVSAIGIQFRVGGNLATVVRTLSETVRDRQKIRGDIKTLTAQQSLTGWLISAIPVILVVALLVINREYMSQIFHPGPQRYFAAAGGVMMVVGNVVIRRILRIEV